MRLGDNGSAASSDCPPARSVQPHRKLVGDDSFTSGEIV